MIKIEKNHDCESFFRNDDLYDSKRKKEFKIIIFGLTFYKRIDNYLSELKSDNGKSIGFKK